eukprot:TRINITY_DN6137_c0_g1_i11.p1 TRINITY_DN6137_c0_g1~~TRINITY_DN6137_c0_g1_i11.p1  ORF type:complete len:142 (+),score=18.87 TRINITY_DN6137_c0_g1_i11:147-572(+)
MVEEEKWDSLSESLEGETVYEPCMASERTKASNDEVKGQFDWLHYNYIFNPFLEGEDIQIPTISDIEKFAEEGCSPHIVKWLLSCIDRKRLMETPDLAVPQDEQEISGRYLNLNRKAHSKKKMEMEAVSYTHLTLPTICSV